MSMFIWTGSIHDIRHIGAASGTLALEIDFIYNIGAVSGTLALEIGLTTTDEDTMYAYIEASNEEIHAWMNRWRDQ